MNSLWHKAHVLAKKATLAQRVAWHREHQRVCACRPVPASLREHFDSAAAKPPAAPPRAKARPSSIAPVELPALFSKVVAAFASEPHVTFGGKGFGKTGLKWDGTIFAMIAQGRFVAKLPSERVDALVAKGQGKRFEPGHGRVMKEWLVASPANTRWLALAREALEFAQRG